MREVDRVPQLVAGWEEKAAALTPEQGFLLSRIDGRTQWGTLRSIAGLPEADVDRCIEEWVRDGLVELFAPTPEPAMSPAAPATTSSAGLAIDESLAVPVEVQRQALVLQSQLDGSYHQLLGVGRQAKSRDIKRAYFKLARDFHPDRYFGKEVGAYGELLDRIFKQVALAYELLMDPTTRSELELSMGPAPAPAPTGQPQTFTKHEWLARMRKQFRLPDEVLAERRQGAKNLAEAAQVAQHQGRWAEAAQSIRLAIAFDPWNPEYKSRFAEIQVEFNRIRAEDLLREANGAWDSRSQAEALKLYEEVLHYRPADTGATMRAAQLCFELDEFDKALDFAELACELAPDVADHQLTRGRILRRLGRRERAREVLATAQQIDPTDTRIADELRALRQPPSRTSGGKR